MHIAGTNFKIQGQGDRLGGMLASQDQGQRTDLTMLKSDPGEHGQGQSLLAGGSVVTGLGLTILIAAGKLEGQEATRKEENLGPDLVLTVVSVVELAALPLHLVKGPELLGLPLVLLGLHHSATEEAHQLEATDNVATNPLDLEM